MAAIFIIDLLTPRGIAIWVGYIIFITMTYWLSSQPAPLIVAVVGAGLTIVGGYLSQPGAPAWIAITNRMLGMSALAVTAALVWSAKRRHDENLRLKDVDRLKSEFLSAFSHQIRTPLTAITGYVSHLLEHAAGPLTDKQTDYLQRAARNVDRIARLTGDMLDLAKIEAGNVDVAQEFIQIEALLGEVAEGLRAAADDKHIVLELDVARDLPRVYGDREKLLHALWNIGANAIKFSPCDGRVRFAASQVDSEVRICVSDSGPGIAHEDVDKIFIPFYRSPHTAHEQGSGLGLPIAQRLIELHRGRIWAESEPGRGATFCVQLPSG